MEKIDFDAIVVGAGFGGSSCAGLLAKHGLNVLLVEKNNRAGGKAMTISKGGFTHTAWFVAGAPVEGNLPIGQGMRLRMMCFLILGHFS